jgi:pimeloyl-ACP methyl ester carboxylesterase
MTDTFRIEPPYYPIVYVRGYAMREADRDETFNDTYYGFSATSVEKRQVPPPDYFEVDLFEGQLIRFMKIKKYGYADSVNRGLELFAESPSRNPSRSLWVSRFYDRDVMTQKVRPIEEHAADVMKLITETIPGQLKDAGVDLGADDKDFRVILIAHSMGGLVCRSVIQKLLPARQQDPKRWIHRLVTLGTPHGGIELGQVTDAVERFVGQRFNPFDSGIFQPKQMRKYLALDASCDLYSLGLDGPFAFPPKRCLCLIGSDYRSYGIVQHITGDFSDGLVKQNRAFLVAGPSPIAPDPEVDPPSRTPSYPDEQLAFSANVHRAHSGARGIVNSYESYENIQRFLFGDTMVRISLEDISIGTATRAGEHSFYDFEFLFSVRKTGVYLHRREQDPCENAWRFERADVPSTIPLHVAFLNSRLRDPDDPYSHFSGKLRVVEHRVKQNFVWDHEYPDRPIYNETVELRVGGPPDQPTSVQYRWLSDVDDWQAVDSDQTGRHRLTLRGSSSLSGALILQASQWPDIGLTKESP